MVVYTTTSLQAVYQLGILASLPPPHLEEHLYTSLPSNWRGVNYACTILLLSLRPSLGEAKGG